jgi:hypothetical protein
MGFGHSPERKAAPHAKIMPSSTIMRRRMQAIKPAGPEKLLRLKF